MLWAKTNAVVCVIKLSHSYAVILYSHMYTGHGVFRSKLANCGLTDVGACLWGTHLKECGRIFFYVPQSLRKRLAYYFQTFGVSQFCTPVYYWSRRLNVFSLGGHGHLLLCDTGSECALPKEPKMVERNEIIMCVRFQFIRLNCINYHNSVHEEFCWCDYKLAVPQVRGTAPTALLVRWNKMWKSKKRLSLQEI